MESLIHLLDINDANMAWKVVSYKRRGGLEAPINSFELPTETSYGLYAARDNNILYAHHNAKESSDKDYYSAEAPIRRLISEEISKRPNTRSNAPSVVARLMGVYVLPFDSKPGRKLVPIEDENPMGRLMDNERLKKGSVGHDLSTTPNCSQELEVGPTGHRVDRYSDQYNSGMKLIKLKPREHLQEEQLQKFKKEFEARQAARFKECSNVVKFSSFPDLLIAQEDLNKEKMHLYANSKRTQNIERLREPNDLAELVDSHAMLTFGNLCYSAEGKECLYTNTMPRTDFMASQLMNSDQKLDIVSAPSKIVILRPCPDRMNINEDLWNNTPSTSEERGSIEDFLKEVNERLKSEMQGICPKRNTTVRGGGIETPFREKATKPQEIAQEVRGSVSRDHGMNFLRSESTRSYQSEITGSPELFINGDTRKFLSERLRNVLKGETHGEVPIVVRNSSRFSMSDYENVGPRQSRETWIDNKTNYRECEMSRSDVSPGNLIRSLSAPVSGASFGKLLLEDRHILSGAQIRRKHEVVEKENSTEVPPSPASVCSSMYDQLWRLTDYLSPVSSSSGGHQLEDSEMSHVFREINSNLSELRRKLDQLEGSYMEETINEHETAEVEVVVIEDQFEAYIRDLLIAAGLFDGSFSQSLSKWDPLGKPISTQVFIQVEETYKESTKGKDRSAKVNHNMILDLLNEVLPAILREPVNMCRSMENADGLVHKPPHGRKLLSIVWNNIRAYVHPPADRSYYALDDMLARDLKSDPWSRLMMDHDVTAIERQLIGDMIEEMVVDMHS